MIPPGIFLWRKKSVCFSVIFPNKHKPLNCFCNSFLPACAVLNYRLSNRSKQEKQNLSHRVSEGKVRKLHWNIIKETTETNFLSLGNDLDAIITLFLLRVWGILFWKLNFQVIIKKLLHRLITIARSDSLQKLLKSSHIPLQQTFLTSHKTLGGEKLDTGKELSCARGGILINSRVCTKILEWFPRIFWC